MCLPELSVQYAQVGLNDNKDKRITVKAQNQLQRMCTGRNSFFFLKYTRIIVCRDSHG